jgi:TPP-dependent pyruvate/acetoin dehydrogenase alpha subunit
VLENNGYGEASPTEFVTPMTDLAKRAASYEMPALVADGMDFFDVYEKASEAIANARAGKGPTLLECKTYRFMGHYVGDPLTYRTKEESDEWMQNNDPLDNFENHVVEAGLLESDDLRNVDGDVVAELDASVVAAQAAPFPDPSEVLTDVYAS